jgi:hypothetical protein
MGDNMKRQTNKLVRWEIAIVKSMLDKGYIPQDIQSYFSRPTRSINHGRIKEIKDGVKHKAIKTATDAELDAFLDAWPNVDPATGLHHEGDELLIKAREAMTAAVHTFNSAGLYFRAELFIVTAIIAWTYLLHEYYRRKNIDYRHKKAGVVQKTPSGAEKYWELSHCISIGACPLEKGVINNLKFLIEIRNEIEHRSTNRIDEQLSAKLQACCINFNDALKKLFGREHALEKRLPIALQFVTFDGAQRASLIRADLPAHITTAMDNFHNALSDDEQKDPQFRYRVAFVPMIIGKASKSDLAIEFVKPGSPEAEKAERIILKEVEPQKYLPTDIVEKVQAAGFVNFNMFDHTKLVEHLKAKKKGSGYGTMVAKTWYWYENWVEVVKQQLADGWTRPVRGKA